MIAGETTPRYATRVLLKMPVLEAIKDGRVNVAYRRWKRSTVKAGGTLKTAVGVLAIDAVEPIDPDALDTRAARAAGEASLAALKKTLDRAAEVRSIGFVSDISVRT